MVMLAADQLDPLALYASGIDGSDYVARVAPLIRRTVGCVGSLLDVGGGAGQLGHALRSPGHLWTVIEPASSMQHRLRAVTPSPIVLPCGWREARPVPCGHETVLAANIAAPLYEAEDFLSFCRRSSRRHIVWVVPAQNGPRGMCLAGCLPTEWHGEDETPGVDLVFDQLPPRDHPRYLHRIDWCFRLDVPSIPTIASYLADRLGWNPGDERRTPLRAHLARRAKAVPGGFRLTVPRMSAILIW